MLEEGNRLARLTVEGEDMDLDGEEGVTSSNSNSCLLSLGDETETVVG